MAELNVITLCDKLWGWLNTALLDKAHEYFEAADELNGFDGWRRIVQQIHKGSKTRNGNLRRLVKKMPMIARVEDFDSGILRFEAIMRDYDRAGGVVPTSEEMKEDLIDILPREISEQLTWRTNANH